MMLHSQPQSVPAGAHSDLQAIRLSQLQVPDMRSRVVAAGKDPEGGVGCRCRVSRPDGALFVSESPLLQYR